VIEKLLLRLKNDRKWALGQIKITKDNSLLFLWIIMCHCVLEALCDHSVPTYLPSTFFDNFAGSVVKIHHYYIRIISK
jgi:hypothetical protein